MSHPLSQTIKALGFDIFGTAVDWHTSITTTLHQTALAKLSSTPPLPPALQTRLASLTPKDWSLFASQWRDTYSTFTHTFNPETTPFQTVDAHHHASLLTLLADWSLQDVYTPEETTRLSLAWHFLAPWPDSAAGLARLRAAGYKTATLSNGNRALLADLDTHGNLGFGEKNLIGAEDFGMYKPRSEVYLGACRLLGASGPGEVAMVAAHLGDLEAARGLGMRTVYVERRGEEEWGVEEERYKEARGWVDLWVGEGEGGFEEVARALGG